MPVNPPVPKEILGEAHPNMIQDLATVGGLY